MGENQGIEMILGKLVELLTEKKNESQSSSSSKENMPHSEVVQKLELMPNDIKLEGIRNYLAWSRRALLLLKAKKLEGFVNGKVAEPEDKSSDEWKAWDATNSLVVAWLFSSMSPTIAGSVDTIATASGVWDALSKMYSGAGNVMLLVDTDDKLYHLKQGELSLMDYVAELKRLWADLDYYDPIELPHSECVAWVKKWMEKKRVLQFLRGLNPEFEGRRASMFHQSSLPSLEEAIAAMAQEETRLNVMKANASAPPRPAYVVTGTQETRICYNCGDKGHLSRDCHQPFKFNRGRGRSSARGALRGGGSRGGRRGYRANLAAIEEAAIEETRSHCGSRGMASEFVTIPVAELEELRKQKRNEEGSKSNDQRQTPSIDSSGTLDQAFTSIQNYNSDWILDSGASRHVK